MILADGIIDAREMETLYRIGRETYGIPAEEINDAIRESGTSFLIPETLNEKVSFLGLYAKKRDEIGVNSLK